MGKIYDKESSSIDAMGHKTLISSAQHWLDEQIRYYEYKARVKRWNEEDAEKQINICKKAWEIIENRTKYPLTICFDMPSKNSVDGISEKTLNNDYKFYKTTNYGNIYLDKDSNCKLVQEGKDGVYHIFRFDRDNYKNNDVVFIQDFIRDLVNETKLEYNNTPYLYGHDGGLGVFLAITKCQMAIDDYKILYESGLVNEFCASDVSERPEEYDPDKMQSQLEEDINFEYPYYICDRVKEEIDKYKGKSIPKYDIDHCITMLNNIGQIGDMVKSIQDTMYGESNGPIINDFKVMVSKSQ